MVNECSKIKVKYFTNSNMKSKDAASISGFGEPARFIKTISLPKELRKGQEFINNKEPIIIIRRTKSILSEFFTRPLFCITKMIRIQFHWEGIEIVGSYMESSNKFLFPIPSKKVDCGWFLKVICKSSSFIGFKPLYISVDTFHENVLLKWFFLTIKYLFFFSLVAIVILIVFFSDLINLKLPLLYNFLGKEISQLDKVSPIIFLLFIFIAFWGKINETFKSFYKKEPVKLSENLEYNGIKGFSGEYGIEVV